MAYFSSHFFILATKQELMPFIGVQPSCCAMLRFMLDAQMFL